MKCVIVLAAGLPSGVAANVAAILGSALGKKLPGTVGSDLPDGGGGSHAGISRLAIPVLQCGAEDLPPLRAALLAGEGCTVADFPALAQSCRDYGEYAARLGGTPPEALSYLGVAACGPWRQVSRLTGRLPLLR